MNPKRILLFHSGIMTTSLLTLCLFVILRHSGLMSSRVETEKTEPNDWMAMQRTYPYDHINPQAVNAAILQTKQMMDDRITMTSPWIMTGPSNIGGRITDVEIAPDDMNTIYYGAATGGVFKSTDFGVTWDNLFGSIPVISVGDIAIDPNNSSTIFVGTGEANSSSFSFLGDGIYKSTDAGQTWQNMGLSNSAYIGRVLVDYSNSQRIFVAACGHLFSYNSERGVYRSNDGGQSWQRILFLTDSTAAIDIVQDPVNPLVLYASMWERTRGLAYRNSFGNSSGIWKSVNGGDNWNEVTSGLPTGNNVGRIGLTICKTNPAILYAFYDMYGGATDEVRVYKTINNGLNWTRCNDGVLSGMNSNFGWYLGQIRVNPQNANQVFVMGVSLFRSDNGGNSWTDLSYTNIHVDHHALTFDEINNRIIEGNDGGLYNSTTSGNSWIKFNNLPITQFYAIDIDNLNPDRIYGGTQDNNTIRTLTGGSNDWDAILGGDGMYTLVDYTNSNVIYAEYQYGNLYRSDDLGFNMNYIAGPMASDRANWSAPLAMDPNDPTKLYFGTYRVWKTIDMGNNWTPVSGDLTKGGVDWFHTITTIAISHMNTMILVAGTGDGKLHVSTNGGQSWTDRSAGLPDRWITRVIADPFDGNTIYATCSGFRWDEPLPHVFKSSDLGQDWTDISANLPEFPVNDIVLDPMIQDRIIVGTDAGVYGTTNGGLSWYWIWNDLPAVPVCVMKIHPTSRKIVAGTYGLSTYSANIDDIFTGMPVASGKSNIRMTVTPNPWTSATRILFYLPENEKITLEIIGIDGQELKKLHNGQMMKGKQSVILSDAAILAPGIYFISLEGTNFRSAVKFIKGN